MAVVYHAKSNLDISIPPMQQGVMTGAWHNSQEPAAVWKQGFNLKSVKNVASLLS